MMSLNDYNKFLNNEQALQKQQYKILNELRATMNVKDWLLFNQIYQTHRKIHTALTQAQKKLLNVDVFHIKEK